MTVQTAVQQFLQHEEVVKRRSPATIEAYRADLACFVETLNRGSETPIEAVTVTDINQWLMSMSDRSTSTVRRRLSALSSFSATGIVLGYAQENPVDRIKRPSHKRRIQPTPGDQQVQQLLDAAPNHQQRTIILLLDTTALRQASASITETGKCRTSPAEACLARCF